MNNIVQIVTVHPEVLVHPVLNMYALLLEYCVICA